MALNRSLKIAAAAILLPLAASKRSSEAQPSWRFVDVTQDAGLDVVGLGDEGVDPVTGLPPRPPTQLEDRVAGGVAAGDYDGDGLVDLYLVAPRLGRNFLFRNRGNGTFAQVGAEAGVDQAGARSTGPLFFDGDGDGRIDLFVGALTGGRPALLRNLGNGQFADVTATSGIASAGPTISASAGDYDGDGRLDLFLSHWGAALGACHLWRNQGDGRFACADGSAGLDRLVRGLIDRTFTANFTDVDQDGRVDLLVAADFGESSVWINQGAGRFGEATTPVISDENGMGSAVGDFDGDGRLDWFVSSIFDDDGIAEGDWGLTGNRLYRNLGGGAFADVTDLAGVRDGNWGWGATFVDLDNDGRLDLVQVNGWPQGSPQFRDSPTRLFLGGAGGHFSEQAVSLGLDDRGDGRGVTALDFDEDGDVDLFIANRSGAHRLWRNDGGRARGHYLDVEVASDGQLGNPQAIGARVTVVTADGSQVREVRAGSNYASQDPLRAHFGLGTRTRVDRVEVVWPDGRRASIADIAADQKVVVTPAASPDAPETPHGC
jgi:hypothetical protein